MFLGCRPRTSIHSRRDEEYRIPGQSGCVPDAASPCGSLHHTQSVIPFAHVFVVVVKTSLAAEVSAGGNGDGGCCSRFFTIFWLCLIACRKEKPRSAIEFLYSKMTHYCAIGVFVHTIFFACDQTISGCRLFVRAWNNRASLKAWTISWKGFRALQRIRTRPMWGVPFPSSQTSENFASLCGQRRGRWAVVTWVQP